jgi:multimeric flavodoxin WrbA
VDYAIAPGVEYDMGDGDQWPQIRNQVLDSDILLLSTPVWLGHPCSMTQRVLERLDAELSNSGEAGRPVLAGKVAIVSVSATRTVRTRPSPTCFKP